MTNQERIKAAQGLALAIADGLGKEVPDHPEVVWDSDLDLSGAAVETLQKVLDHLQADIAEYRGAHE